MKRPHVLVCIVGVLLLGGCQAFRAEVGVGLGLGVDIAVPGILHAGVGMGGYDYVGHDYDRGWVKGRRDGDWSHSASILLVHSVSHNRDLFPGTGTWESGQTHFCGGLAPVLWDLALDVEQTTSYALELGVHLFVVGFRIGFNPWYLWSN
jgi:hypothetical protein